MKPLVLAIAMVGLLPPGGGATPTPKSVAGWTAYVDATERRLAAERMEASRFLSIDRESRVVSIRQRLRAGDVLLERVTAADASGKAVDVPSAMVHDWRGTMFVPGATLVELVDGLESDVPPQRDLMAARIDDRRGDALHVAMRVRRSAVVTVVYEIDCDVVFARVDAAHATSTSVATSIREIADAGTAREHLIAAGDDHGYLWRWNTYWRYEAVAGGVIVECESLSLSRRAPPLLGILIDPVITRTAKDAMTEALLALRRVYARPGA